MIVIVFYLWWHLLHPWDCVNHLTSSHPSCTIFVFAKIQIWKYKNIISNKLIWWWNFSLPWDCVDHLILTPLAQCLYLHKYKYKIMNCVIEFFWKKVITVFEKFIQQRERSIHALGPWGLIGAFHFRSSVPLNWLLGRQICVVFTKLAFGGTKFASSSSMWFCVCKLSALYWHPIMKKVHVTIVY